MEYPEKGVEGLLRSYIQFTPECAFHLFGQQKAFDGVYLLFHQKAFYQSTQKLFLAPIPYTLTGSLPRNCLMEEKNFAGRYLP